MSTVRVSLALSLPSSSSLLYFFFFLLFSLKKINKLINEQKKIVGMGWWWASKTRCPLVQLVLLCISIFPGRVIDPYKGIQDNLGFWIPRRGFRITSTGFQSLLVKLGFWNPIYRRIPNSLSCIPDSKAHDSGFHKHKFGARVNMDRYTFLGNCPPTPP